MSCTPILDLDCLLTIGTCILNHVTTKLGIFPSKKKLGIFLVNRRLSFHFPEMENNLGSYHRIFWRATDHQVLKDVHFLCQSACQLLRLSITEFFFEMLGILFQTQMLHDYFSWQILQS